jgi:hypothetical protein
MKKSIGISLGIFVIIFGVSCKKDDASYTVPATYNFANVNYSNQTMLLAMADQLLAAVNTANTIPQTAVSLTTLNNLFNNTNSPFNDSTYNLNGASFSLADYAPAQMKSDLVAYFDSISVYSSQSSTVAAPGVPGVGTSSATGKKYLLSANGVFYSQVIKKAIMGLCAYQITNVYMTDSINSTTDIAKLGHYWDAAFGYFGVPVNFPAVTTGLKYFGSYCNQVNAGLNSNAIIMNTFLKGRAAISNNDIATMKAQSKLLIAEFDTLNAACVVQEMHETEADITATSGPDAVAAQGTMSESLGFVRNFQYNTGTRVITAAQITSLLDLYDSANPNNPNLYNFINVLSNQTPGPQSNTEVIAQYIGNIYGFTATQLPLL